MYIANFKSTEYALLKDSYSLSNDLILKDLIIFSPIYHTISQSMPCWTRYSRDVNGVMVQTYW